MDYFETFPRIGYDISGDGKKQLTTDITRSFFVRQLTRDNLIVLYEYEVKDGERPDQIAYKYYGNEKLDWLVLMANDIMDPYYEWPLDQDSLNSYISQKYGSISTAQSIVHHYEKIIQTRTVVNNPDGENVVTPERVIIVDEDTYNTLPAIERRSVDCYKFEIDRNDNRRKIKLIDKVHLPAIMEGLRRAFS